MAGMQINDENVTCEEGFCVLSASNCTVCPAGLSNICRM
jgi:hypothetical protein